MIVGNTLTLEADIDVTGKGLKGGIAAQGAGVCVGNSTSVYFEEVSDSAGYKGEGAASYAWDNSSPLGKAYKKGRGPLFNGGGGGNAKYSGGAGGGNYGYGGAGGKESQSCGDYFIGGIGGRDIASLPGKRIFMGGGGGSATQQNPGDATDGGNGGGIIIIVADTLIGNGNSIIANGADVYGFTNNNGGAGGGGAGGTILLEVNDYKGSNLNVGVTGGKGGDSGSDCDSCTGPGGGGGAGVVWHSITTFPAQVSVDTTGGDQGNSNCLPACFMWGMAPGDNGDTISGLRVPLSGFLFNSIFSFYTGADHDTICESDTPPKMLGTEPKGGTPPYEYRWESSEDKTTWVAEVDWPGNRDYQPVNQLIDTTFYRRLVRDQSVPKILDISKILTIIVQPKIEQNSFSFDTTICFGQVPNPIAPEFASPFGGDGIYTYYWQKSIDAIYFDPADGVNTAAIYSPPALTDTTYFRRTVYSGKCQHTSDTITITVLPLIANNSITDNQIICEGSVFNQLDGSAPTGGEVAGTYTFQWIESTDGSTWVDAFSPGTGEDYSPDTLSVTFPSTDTVYFSRIVLSGPADVCIDTSDVVKLVQWPKITTNTIMTDEVICEDDDPTAISGLNPSGGDGSNYLYQWQKLNGSWTDISGATAMDYDPGQLTDTTLYRRIVTSDVVCKDTSNVDTIPVNPAILNYNIQTLSGTTDTTICSGQVPNKIIPETTPVSGGVGTYSYIWEKSTDGGSVWNVTGGDTPDLSPAALNTTTLFRRWVASGQCQEVSDTITINVLPLISDNVITPATSSVCYNSNISLTTIDPSGGDGSYTYYWKESPDNSTWESAIGINNQRDYTSPALLNSVYYRRKVISGPSDCCQHISPSVFIDIDPLPGATITSIDTAICDGSSAKLTLNLTGASPWILTYNDGYSDKSITISGTPKTEKVSPAATGEFTSYSYTIVDLVDGNDCIADPADLTGLAKVRVDGIPVADAGVDDEVCGLTDTLQAVAGSFGTGQWTFPVVVADVSDDTNPNKVVQVNAEGTYTFTWVVTNGVCAPVPDEVQIIFWEQPDVADAGIDQNLDPGKTETYLEGNLPTVGTGVWTKYQADAPAVIADPNDPSTEVSNLAIGDNKFIWTISNGICPVESDEVYITVNIIVPPNVFTPNNDGINDFYVIPGIENRRNELIVVNRLGTEVFGAENYQNNWDGKYKGEDLPEDIYYYALYIYWDDGVEKMSGYIVIKRQ